MTTPTFEKPSDLVAWSIEQDLGDVTDNFVLRHYYQAFLKSFGPQRRHKYDLQLEGLTEAVRSGEVKTVLDVGCGCGSVSLWLALQGADVTGIDITDERLKVANRRAEMMGSPARFQHTNILDMAGTYDALWIEQAYHHLEPRKDVQAKIASLLNPGGRLIISETNAWNPFVQLMLLKWRGFRTIHERIDDEGKVHIYGEERITTPGDLTRGFRRYGVTADGPVKFYGVLPNRPVFERLASLENMTPAFMVPVFSHYLWQGRKAA